MSKRKTLISRLAIIILIPVIVTLIIVFARYLYLNQETDSQVMQINLPVARAGETDTIQLMDIPEIEDGIRDVVFSADSSTWYALSDTRLYAIALNGSDSQLLASVSIPPDYEAYTLAVSSDTHQLAIGTMHTVNDYYYKSAGILFVDTDTMSLSDTVYESENSYNYGSSLELAFTPDGSQLYHLYNLNNAGCGRTSNHLEIWDMSTQQMEDYPLPSNFVTGFMLSDDMLALQINTECSASLSEGSRLTFFTDDGQEISFPSGGTTGYKNLTVSADETLFAGVLAYTGSSPLSIIHIWSNDDTYTLQHTIEVNQTVKSMALSPDNRYLVVSVAPGFEGALHFINLETGEIDYSIQTWQTRITIHVMFSPDGHYMAVNSVDARAFWYLP